MTDEVSRSLQSYLNDAFAHRAQCRCGHVFGYDDPLYCMPHKVGREYLVNFRPGPQMLYFYCSQCGHATMYEHSWRELKALPPPAPKPPVIDERTISIASLLGMQVLVYPDNTGIYFARPDQVARLQEQEHAKKNARRT